MQINLAGTTFRNNTTPPKIGDYVTLNHDKENEHDKNAVEVLWHTFFLGYLPKGSDAQKLFFQKKLKAKIVDYSFSRGVDPDTGEREFNNEDEGQLASVTLEIEYFHYEKDGKGYRRITEFLDKVKHEYEKPESLERLKVWNDRNKDMLKYTAKMGDFVHDFSHDLMEIYQKIQDEYGEEDNLRTCENIMSAFHGSGIANWISKRQPRNIKTERTHKLTVFDEQTGLAGTPDFICEVDHVMEVDDYKSASQVREKMLYQLAFYCKMHNIKRGRIIFLGGDQKQKFGEKVIDESEINERYNHIVLWAKKYGKMS